jgi:hypothetical protein
MQNAGQEENVCRIVTVSVVSDFAGREAALHVTTILS